MKNLIITSIFTLLLFGCKGETPKTQTSQGIRPTMKPVIPTFSGHSAYLYLKAQTDLSPRVPGSKAHEKCLNYLHSEISKYADAVSLQPFLHKDYNGKHLKMTNIISSFNLRAKTRILLLAHWDSRPRADQDSDSKKKNQPVNGANDGASGVAVLMEIARLIKSSQPHIGVDILFTDGEDFGKQGDDANYLLGARYFAKNLPLGFHPTFGILLDMIGDSQLEIKKERYSMKYAPDVVDLVWTTARQLGVEQFSEEYQGWVTDDHLPLNEVGIKTIDLIDFDYPDESNRYWHTTQDTPDKCSPESLEAVGKVLIEVIYNYPVTD